MPNIYADGLDHLDQTWTTPKRYTEAEATRLRNQRAKELRAEGWTVKCGTTSFSGLGYGKSIWLRAERKPRR